MPSREEVLGYATAIVLTGMMLVLCAAFAGCMGSDPPASSSAPDPPDVSAGKQIYSVQGCAACHAIAGSGGKLGPDLSNEANEGHSRQWLITQMRDPKTHKPDTIMPAYASLTDAQVEELVGYLLSLSKEKKAATSQPATTAGTQPSAAPAEHPAIAAADRIKTGGQMWSDTCGRCHNFRAPSEFSNAQWAVVMRHMRLRVPLTGEQERLILEFLQSGR